MPLPMIHLAIAVQIGAQDERCLSPAFLLGSIAPDLIHMRPGISRDDKKTTHLIPRGEGSSPDEAIWTLVRSHQADALAVFTLAYAAHVLTDRLWMRQVIDDFEARIPPQILADKAQRRALYYGERDQIDFNLYHHAPWRPEVWRKLAAARRPSFPPWLSASEIDQWRSRTLRWFTDALVADFVRAAADHVQDLFAAWGIATFAHQENWE